jgi:hypothetical protein
MINGMNVYFEGRNFRQELETYFKKQGISFSKIILNSCAQDSHKKWGHWIKTFLSKR